MLAPSTLSPGLVGPNGHSRARISEFEYLSCTLTQAQTDSRSQTAYTVFKNTPPLKSLVWFYSSVKHAADDPFLAVSRVVMWMHCFTNTHTHTLTLSMFLHYKQSIKIRNAKFKAFVKCTHTHQQIYPCLFIAQHGLWHISQCFGWIRLFCTTDLCHSDSSAHHVYVLTESEVRFFFDWSLWKF